MYLHRLGFILQLEKEMYYNNNKSIDFFSSMVAIAHFDLQKHTSVNQSLIEYFIFSFLFFTIDINY